MHHFLFFYRELERLERERKEREAEEMRRRVTYCITVNLYSLPLTAGRRRKTKERS